ncbi:MAG: RNA methyltransferase [Actinomycetes bacterium]
MSAIVAVTAADDPRLADYANLTDVALRRRVETEHGLFIAEGEKVIRRALDAGFVPRSVLMSQRWLPGLAPSLEAFNVPVFVASEAVLEQVTGFVVHRGALAAMNRRPPPPIDAVLEGATRLLVLEGMVEHTNVGAAFRSAAALGVDAVLVDPRCADPLYRRSVKVSMGAVFALPWTRAETWPGGMATVRQAGFELWAFTPDESAESLEDAVLALPPRLALMVGTEGPGLSRHALGMADRRVRIPMGHGIDSLNAAAATAVACYATRPRRRRPEDPRDRD